MKNIIIALILTLAFATSGFAVSMPTDDNNNVMPVFPADPGKSQVNTAVTGTYVCIKAATGGLDIRNWAVIKIDPTANATYYFNSDTTKTYPLRAETDNYIYVKHLGLGGSVTIVLGSATASVQGM
jgi:hypothetical protein